MCLEGTVRVKSKQRRIDSSRCGIVSIRVLRSFFSVAKRLPKSCSTCDPPQIAPTARPARRFDRLGCCGAMKTTRSRETEINTVGGVKFLDLLHERYAGRRVCHSVARSSMLAARKSLSSSNGPASNCRPIGRPLELNPHGSDSPGMPARLALIV